MPLLTAEERVGTEIGGRYKINRILGEGAFGAVFSAEHTLTSRQVALKLLHAHLVSAEQMAQRFLREAQAMAKLRHPSIVQVLDAGKEPDGTLFLALELLEGETLEDTLARSGRLTIQESVQIAEAVLGALAVAHAAGIVHRDIKPANIYLAKEPNEEPRPKLLDFGIAAVTSSQERAGKLTNAGMILGTPEYMAPEQGRSSQVGPGADLWSVGIVLYEMFSGVVPWSSDSATAVLLSVASDPLPSITQFAEDLPPGLVAVVERALQKRPEDRYASALEMREAMLRAAEESGHFKRSSSPASSPSGMFSAAELTGGTASAKRRAQDEIDFGGGGGSLALAIDPSEASHTGRFGRVPTGRHTTSPKQRAPMPDVLPEPSTSDEALGGTLLAKPEGLVAAEELPLPDLPMPEPPPAPAPPAMNFGGGSSPRLEAPRATTGTNHNNSGLLQAPSAGDLRSTGPNPSLRSTGANAAYAGARPTATTTEPAVRSRPAPEPDPASKKLSPLVFALPVVAIAVVVGVLALRQPSGGGLGVVGTAEPSASMASASVNPIDAPPSRRLTERRAIGLPFGVSGPAAAMFGKHLFVGPLEGEARVVATCAAGSVYLFQLGSGEALGTGTVSVACEGHDLVVVPDIDGDAHADVAAISRGRDAILLLGGRGALRPVRSLALPRVAGLAGVVRVNDVDAVVAYVEGANAASSSEVLAVGVTNGQVLWRIAGQAPFTRVGQPLELGVSVGGDVNGDGVGDVAVGLSVPQNMPAEQQPSRPRCVQLFSGANGQALWREPFCQLRGGSQSVSVGGDVDGDGHADVAVGTDVSRGGDGRVVVLSGTDARVLRRVNAPSGAVGQGFGWPVHLGADMNGDQRGELVVGSVGATGTFVTVLSGADGARLAEQPVRGTPGYPNLRFWVSDGVGRGAGNHLLLGSPEDGIHVLAME